MELVESTLFVTLKLFSKEECARLDALIETPLFKQPNRYTDTVVLYRYLFEHLHNNPKSTPELTRTKVAAHLFGHRANPDAELRKAMSQLQGILRQYSLILGITQTLDNPDQEILRQSKLEATYRNWLIERTSQQSNKQDKKTTNKPAKTQVMIETMYRQYQKNHSINPRTLNHREYTLWLFQRFCLEYDMYDYYSKNHDFDEQHKHILLALNALDRFYTQIKMSIIINLQINRFVLPGNALEAPYEIDHQIEMAQNFIHQLPQSGALLHETQLFVLLSALLHQRDIANSQRFETVVALIKNPSTSISDEYRKTVTDILASYCSVRYIKTRDSAYLQRRFDLTLPQLEADLMHNNGTLAVSQLTATVSVALRLGPHMYSWVEEFLERFSDGQRLLGTKTPRETYKVNRAHLLLLQGKVREASNQLVGYDWYSRIDDPQTLLLAIRVDLKAQYELNRYQDDYTIRLLDTAEKRITRIQGLDIQLQNMTLRFLRVMRQVFEVASILELQPRRRTELATRSVSIRQDVEMGAPIAERDWLLEILSTL
jgi:hypothetical protein